MKVALLLSRIEQTGVTTHTLDLVEGLTQKGHEICLITGGIFEKESDRVKDFYNAFLAHGILLKEFKTPSGNLIKRGIISVISVIQIMKWLWQYNPNVIHCQSPYMTFIPWLMRKKFTTTIHILYLKPNFKFKNPQHLIAISRESYEFSQKVFGINTANISLIHHGVSNRFAIAVDKETRISLKNSLNIPQNRIILGFVGSISLRKGSDILVKALKNLEEETQKKIHFIFLGGSAGSKEHQWLDDMIKDAKIDDFVSLISFQDPKPFYDIFDIFVLPSRMESFPLVTLEAMMSGCCIIRSNTEGAYEQVEHGINGFLFENENADELTVLIERLVHDEELRNSFKVKAKERALAEFTIPAMTEKTLKVYEKIKIY